MDIKNKSTTELKVLIESLELELSQRKGEVEIPILRMFSDEIEDFTIDNLKDKDNQEMMIQEMMVALIKKDRTFNIKVVMLPESDYKNLVDQKEL